MIFSQKGLMISEFSLKPQTKKSKTNGATHSICFDEIIMYTLNILPVGVIDNFSKSFCFFSLIY